MVQVQPNYCETYIIMTGYKTNGAWTSIAIRRCFTAASYKPATPLWFGGPPKTSANLPPRKKSCTCTWMEPFR